MSLQNQKGMANSIKINEENIYEWLCSTGYLLPCNEVELQRFEKLHPVGSLVVNETSIDPFAIINKTRQKRSLSISQQTFILQEQEQLRMAARKNSNLPGDVLDQIRKNQQKDSNGAGDRPEN